MFINYIIRNLSLTSREIIKSIPRTLISSFGIIFLIASVIVSISLKNSASDYLKKRIFGELGINQIKITPKAPKSIINFPSGETAIDDNTIMKISKINGIKNIQRVIRLNVPASLKAGMLGMYLKTDILISGVNKSFFKESIPNWKKFRYKEYLPVVIPMFILDIYNNFAATSGLPALGPKALNLLSMEIKIGSSSFVKNKDIDLGFKTKVFGFTDSITSAGIIVPDDFIKDLCGKYSSVFHLNKSCYSCILLIGEVGDIGAIPSVANRIRFLGLNVESQADIAQKTENALFLLNLILFSIIAVIMFLTIIAIFNSYLVIVYNRTQMISIQRMLGASKIRIIFIFILEAGIIGSIYGMLGYFTGYYALIYLTDNISKWIPVLQGLNLRLVPFQYLVTSAVFSTLLSVISAFFPALFAANLNLFKAVKR